MSILNGLACLVNHVSPIQIVANNYICSSAWDSSFDPNFDAATTQGSLVGLCTANLEGFTTKQVE